MPSLMTGFTSYSIEYLWEMTAEIICYKATSHAIAEQFDLMHTGTVTVIHFTSTVLKSVGDISSKEIADANEQKSRMVCNERRIRQGAVHILFFEN